MIYFTKDNCPYTLTSKYNEKIENGVDYSFYNIKAIDLENNIIGELDYRLDLNNKHARLLFIEITNPKYVKQGVGHSLITQFENEISEKGITSISGYYCPQGYDKKSTKNFYLSHGYHIDEVNYEDLEISKQLVPIAKKENEKTLDK